MTFYHTQFVPVLACPRSRLLNLFHRSPRKLSSYICYVPRVVFKNIAIHL